MPLPIATPPETPCRCPACNWQGTAGEALTQFGGMFRCPRAGCGVAVLRQDEAAPVESVPAVEVGDTDAQRETGSLHHDYGGR